jgi:hypothetical protein
LLTLFGRQEKILQPIKVELYGLKLGYKNYFAKGTYFVIGKIDGSPFSCYAKSGSQNLWLPTQQEMGLKICHPEGFSGTLEKAHNHFYAQKKLAEIGLAPMPVAMYNVELQLIKCGIDASWNCYGFSMDRVLSGGIQQILKNLQFFGVPPISEVKKTVKSLVGCCGEDALTLSDYIVLCRYFGVADISSLITGITEKIKSKLPIGFDEGPDMLSLPNVVLDDKGEAKVIDCDICSV